MKILNNFATLSTESRRIELARLLAAGLIRLKLQKASQSTDDDKEFEQTYADGLEDS